MGSEDAGGDAGEFLNYFFVFPKLSKRIHIKETIYHMDRQQLLLRAVKDYNGFTSNDSKVNLVHEKGSYITVEIRMKESGLSKGKEISDLLLESLYELKMILERSIEMPISIERVRRIDGKSYLATFFSKKRHVFRH